MPRAVIVIYDYDPDHHVPGTVGHDEQRCAWGDRCPNAPDHSVLWREIPGWESWWTACDEHVGGLESTDEALVVWARSVLMKV